MLIFVPDEEQPPDVEIHIVDGIFIKQIFIKRKGAYMPQHSHVYDHMSMVATGSVEVTIEGELLGIYRAPTGILIRANKKHLFRTLEPDTTIYCIHNIKDAEGMEIAEEHNFPTEVTEEG